MSQFYMIYNFDDLTIGIANNINNGPIKNYAYVPPPPPPPAPPTPSSSSSSEASSSSQ
jgi:hypothetical protein